MKIHVKEGFYNLPRDMTVPIQRNKANFWVGPNGSGKSMIAAGAMTLSKLGKHEELWMAEVTKDSLNKISIEGFEGFSGITFCSSKMRQAQFVDATVVLSIPNGLGRLRASEGQNAIADMAYAGAKKDDPDHLFIFDETDGHLDTKTKFLFFDRLLPILKGTVIVITHDIFFTQGQDEVFDFADGTVKTGASYVMGNIPYRKPAE